MESTRYSCQIPIKLEFSRQIFEKILKYQIFTKINPVGAEMLHANGRTDITKLIVAFRNITNAPKLDGSEGSRRCVHTMMILPITAV